MKINIALCDDEKAEIDYLSLLLKNWSISKNISTSIIAFNSAEALLFDFEENKNIDILLLDIQLKGIDGITLARKLRESGAAIQIIFITGFTDFMAEGYDVSALHYLLKPVSENKFFEVLDKACEKLNRTEKAIFFTIDGEMFRIPESKIRVIEAQGHYIIAKAITDEYKIKMKLSDIEKQLSAGFFRCHRSFIVNLNYIKKVARTAITMDGGEEIPLSRSLYDAANRAIIEYFP